MKDNETAYRWGEIDFKGVENLFCVWWDADFKFYKRVENFKGRSFKYLNNVFN